MAACSSGNSSPLVLRITHGELVAYADELDIKKEKKHSKKKYQEKTKEKEIKPAKHIDKKDVTDVSQNGRKDDYESKESKSSQEKSKDRAEKDHTKKEKKNFSESKPRRNSLTGKENRMVKDTEAVTNDNKRSQTEDVKKKETELDNEEIEYEDYELKFSARTGEKESVKEGIKQSQPRGIIKLPQGFDFNDTSEEKESANNDKSPKMTIPEEACSSRLYDPGNLDSSVLHRQDVQNSSGNEESALHTSEMATCTEYCIGQEKTNTPDAESSEGYSECQDTNNTSMHSSESGSADHSKVEKKIKSLHLQKAQRLLKMVSQKETLLSNVLSREMIDKAAFEKITSLGKEIQDAYKGIMMLDLAFAIQHEVDQNLWRNGFYKVIETLRKYGKLFLGYAEKTEMLSPEEISNCLKEFLANAEIFYKNLLDLLQKGHDFSVQDVVSQPRKAVKLGKKVSGAILVHKSYW